MFLRSSAIFSTLTFISRIFGFIRDLLIAAFFGTGVFADAFNVAFKLPNFFRGIFAEGAFSAAFVPLFSGKLATDGKKAALTFSSNIFAILIISLVSLILLLEIFMPNVINVLAPGFKANPTKFNFTIFLTTITLPYLFFISLVTFFSCILNSIGKFAAMAASPIILNVSMICGMYFFGETQEEKTTIAAWTVILGGVLQLLMLMYFVAKKKVFPKLITPKLTQDAKNFFSRLSHATLGSGVLQINLWIGTILATSIPGAVSMIYYSERLIQLPVSLIGVSIGIVILPSLSKHFKLKDRDMAITTQNRAIEIALLLSIPCLAALLALAEPIIYVLFERGAFEAKDTISTTPAILTLALGIPAYVVNKIITPAFFAVGDTKTPVRISIFCLVVSIISYLILIKQIGYIGITLTTALTAWVNLFILVFFAYRKEIVEFDVILKIRAVKVTLSSIFLYLFLDAVSGLSRTYLHSENKMIATATLGAIILSGLFVYLFGIHATKAYTLKELKKLA